MAFVVPSCPVFGPALAAESHLAVAVGAVGVAGAAALASEDVLDRPAFVGLASFDSFGLDLEGLEIGEILGIEHGFEIV